MHRHHLQFMTAFIAIAFFLLIATMLIFPAGAATAAETGGSIWGADYFPDVPLITHEGKTVRFFSDVIKGKVVAINFIYTNCPDACALETARLREVQRLLEDRVGRDVFMYSITIDPKHDTPEVLRQYAKKFQIGPGWLFLTGKDADIKLLRKKLGLYSEEEGENLKEHNLSFIIGNQATGQWMKMSPFENPYVLATQLGSWLHNWKMPPKEKRDYAEAPQVRNIGKGEEIFRARCAACHTIGMKESERAGKLRLGPDLLGVTHKRDRAWLLRWMKEPDKMLAEKDPLAMALMAEYNNLPMPNLGLNDVEIQNVLTYIDEESHRMGYHH
jgi:cytochrome oxidase Cu insertion factor (SCO1/SenC/PrrC family)